MIPYEIGEKIINLIEKELGGKAYFHEDYFEGMGTQFSFQLNGKLYTADLWDEDILNVSKQ